MRAAKTTLRFKKCPRIYTIWYTYSHTLAHWHDLAHIHSIWYTAYWVN